MKLRPYQQRAIDALVAYFRAGADLPPLTPRNPLALLPTAAGKSVVQAKFIEWAVQTWPDTRVLCVTHVKELIGQNFEKLTSIWPAAPAGIYSAAFKRREATAQILFCGIQTVHNKAHEIGWVDLLFIDEAHLLPDAGAGQYRSFIAALRKYNPKLRVIGLTATGYRQGQGALTDGDGALFTDVVIDLTQGEELVALIDDGYLSPLHPKRTDTRVSVANVSTTGGDFNRKQLEEALDDETTAAAVAEALTIGAGRKSWLWFCPGVKNAGKVRDALRAIGEDCEIVTGDMPQAERDDILRRFKAGELKHVANFGVLTTGFDHPGLDMIVLLRATKSASLHVQMLGRGMRVVYALGFDLDTREGRLAAIAAGPKPDGCLVADFAGNTARLGPINAVRMPKKRGQGGGEAGPPTKECPKCREECPAAARVCPGCGHEFPPAEKELYRNASTEKMIVRAADLEEWVRVDDVRYSMHAPPDKRPTMRVTYECGLRTFNEWICVGHPGYGGQKAAQWWIKRTPRVAPLTVEHALDATDSLAKPKAIKVSHAQKYPEIIGFDFIGDKLSEVDDEAQRPNRRGAARARTLASTAHTDGLFQLRSPA